jgi:hypothetical protein
VRNASDPQMNALADETHQAAAIYEKIRLLDHHRLRHHLLGPHRRTTPTN